MRLFEAQFSSKNLVHPKSVYGRGKSLKINLAKRSTSNFRVKWKQTRKRITEAWIWGVRSPFFTRRCLSYCLQLGSESIFSPYFTQIAQKLVGNWFSAYEKPISGLRSTKKDSRSKICPVSKTNLQQKLYDLKYVLATVFIRPYCFS